LGAAFAAGFLQAGGRVAVIDLATPSMDGVLGVRCDASDPDQLAEAFTSIGSELGGLDVLVNSIRYRPKADEPPAWSRELQVNLDTYYYASRLAYGLMSRSILGGSIVNVSSVTSFLVADVQTTAYHCSKAAIDQLTRCLAVEYGPANVRVNAVLPGLISRASSEPASESSDASLYARQAISIPLRRSGGPEELSNAILFLASPLASFVTGQCLVVDGGLSIREQLSVTGGSLVRSAS